jgi:dTDP-4-dehydrorhamnose reductase
MAIWLIGSKGMLGTELSLLLQKNGIACIETDRELDITDASALKVFAEKTMAVQPFNWIVNCAAYTAVDRAEDDAETCRRLNADGPTNIADCAKNAGARLMHISTDYVFDGQGVRPYSEADPTDPIGVYGLTKRDGELAALEKNPCTSIVRTASLYGRHGNNFVKTMLKLMNERNEIKVVHDQRGSPTWAFDLASAIIAFIKAGEIGKAVPFGTYHYTNEGTIVN